MTNEDCARTGKHEGGCLCGALRYRVGGPVQPAVHCHCVMCRRGSGALVMTWATVAAEDFAVTKGRLAEYRSSDHGTRGFCPACGAQVTFRSSRRSAEVDLTLGTLDCVERHPPNRHIWTGSKPAWLHLDEALPAHPGFTAA